MKPVKCRCGGEAYHDSASYWNPEQEEWMPNFWHRVICKNCGTQTKAFYTEAEAVQAWNRAMGATDTNVENKTVKFKQDGKFLRCGKCNRIVDSGYKYCPECGYKLEFE